MPAPTKLHTHTITTQTPFLIRCQAPPRAYLVHTQLRPKSRRFITDLSIFAVSMDIFYPGASHHEVLFFFPIPINYLSLLHPSPPYHTFAEPMVKSSDLQVYYISLRQKLKVTSTEECDQIVDANCGRGFEMMVGTSLLVSANIFPCFYCLEHLFMFCSLACVSWSEQLFAMDVTFCRRRWIARSILRCLSFLSFLMEIWPKWCESPSASLIMILTITSSQAWHCPSVVPSAFSLFRLLHAWTTALEFSSRALFGTFDCCHIPVA
jgi:hypothetical protein